MNKTRGKNSFLCIGVGIPEIVSGGCHFSGEWATCSKISAIVRFQHPCNVVGTGSGASALLGSGDPKKASSSVTKKLTGVACLHQSIDKWANIFGLL